LACNYVFTQTCLIFKWHLRSSVMIVQDVFTHMFVIYYNHAPIWLSFKEWKWRYFGFLFIFYGFSTQFPNTISKALSLCCTKVLIEEDSMFANHALHGVKKTLFCTANIIIFQSMWSTFLKLFPFTILIFNSKIMQLKLKNNLDINSCKHYNLPIYVINFFETFSIHYFNIQ
jgi:hypothetical protein